jgi:hypothetical protein
MSGALVIRALLVASAPLVALVPAVRIMSDVLDQDIALPAIGMQKISDVDDRPLRRGSKRFVTERVRVVLYAPDDSSRRAILKLIKSAAADQIRASFPGVAGLAGVTGVSVLGAGGGPSFLVDNIRGGSLDFMVSYNEPA